MSDEVFDPKMFEGDAAGEAANAGGSDVLTLDDLFQEEVNVGEAEAVLARALPPQATYQTDPEAFGPMNVSVARMEEKDGEQVIGHRQVITLTGRGKARIKVNGEMKEVSTGLRVQVSPDVRKSAEYVDGVATGEVSDKDDSKSKLWAQAVGAFKEAFKEAPKSKGAVVEYLRDHPVRYRLSHMGVPTKNNPNPSGEPRAIIVAISAVRAQRQ
jgi:hypothetical protein